MLEQRVLKRLADGPTDLIDIKACRSGIEAPDALNEAITRKLTEEQRADTISTSSSKPRGKRSASALKRSDFNVLRDRC